MMDPRNVAALVVFLFIAGCAPRATIPAANAAAESQPDVRELVAQNTARISVVEASLQSLDRKVANLEAGVSAVTADSMSLQEMKENISFLSGEVLRLDALAKTQPSSGTGVFKPDGFAVEPAYQAALGEYRSGNYETAIGRFTEIITVAPASTLADNAQYWIGESWYSLRTYDRAIEAFQKVFSYPDTNKAPDASVKIGMTHMLMGNLDAARTELTAVMEKYPDSNAAKIAAAKLAAMAKE